MAYFLTHEFIALGVSRYSNRVGGGLAAPVLPHHRTCGSASGGSLRKLKLSLLIEQ